MEDKKIYDYQFVAVPLNLFCRLDNNLRSMLFTLIQLQIYYADEDGWFFRSNEDLKAQSNLSENLVRVTIDTLYKEGLIDVESVGKGKGSNSPSNRYKVLLDRFKDYEEVDIEKCIKDPRFKIRTLNYKGSHYHPSYLYENGDEVTTEVVIADGQVSTQVNDMVDDMVESVVKSEDNIDNIYNIENIDNNSIINNNINNIKEDREVKSEDNIDDNDINNIFDYSIYKNIDTWKKSLPKLDSMDGDEYCIRVGIYELSQLNDVDSIKAKLEEIERRLKKGSYEKLSEEAQNVLSHRCKELSIDIDSIYN